MAKEIAIPWELKYKFALGGWTSLFKGWLYVVREEFGADTALRLLKKIWEMEDRVKNMTNTILKIFNIDGNDAETIGEWWDIWAELTGQEVIILERSKTINRTKVTKCPWKTAHKDFSERSLIFNNIVCKTINPKATVERPKAMCAGDSYCEYVHKIEE